MLSHSDRSSSASPLPTSANSPSLASPFALALSLFPCSSHDYAHYLPFTELIALLIIREPRGGAATAKIASTARSITISLSASTSHYHWPSPQCDTHHTSPLTAPYCHLLANLKKGYITLHHLPPSPRRFTVLCSQFGPLFLHISRCNIGIHPNSCYIDKTSGHVTGSLPTLHHRSASLIQSSVHAATLVLILQYGWSFASPLGARSTAIISGSHSHGGHTRFATQTGSSFKMELHAPTAGPLHTHLAT